MGRFPRDTEEGRPIGALPRALLQPSSSRLGIFVISLVSAWLPPCASRGEAQGLPSTEEGPQDGGSYGAVLALPDDLGTGGAWMDRYGRLSWVLCGMSTVWDYRGGSAAEKFSYRAYIGENHETGDGLRAWTHWPYLPQNVPVGASDEEKESLRGALGRLAPRGMDPWNWADVRRVLLNPVNGGRRQSSWDDHAEGYCPWFSRQGPHLYLDLDFPDGQFLLSLYFVNKDAHWGGANRFRDYTIQVKGIVDQGPGTRERKPGWEKQFEEAPLLAESRVHDFHDGVYKRFFVRGPRELTLRIHKGDSINTILSGIFVDEWVREGVGQWLGGGETGDKGLGTRDKGNEGEGKRSKPQVGRLREICRKALALKGKSPAAFLRVAPQLAGDAGTWAGWGADESRVDHFDKLELLAVLFDTLLQFEARDEIWRRYAEDLASWCESAESAEQAALEHEMWDWCRSAESSPVITPDQVSHLYRRCFDAVLRPGAAPENVEETRSFAIRNAVPRPHLAQVALEALRARYQKCGRDAGGRPPDRDKVPAQDTVRDGKDRDREQAGEGERDGSFATAEELYAWAQCHRQLGEHIIAAREFQRFLERFPKHPQAPMAAERLRFEREAARHEMALRNPEFTVAPAARRPGIVPIPRDEPLKPSPPAPTPKVEVPKVPDDLDPEATTDTPVTGRGNGAARP